MPLSEISSNETIKILPVTLARWGDFESVFGKNGACGGCWCMWWRLPNKVFNELGKEGHKEAMRTLVHQGVEPGLLVYVGGEPVGWVTIAPRTDYVRLKTSRMLAPVDDQPVWSMPCFFVRSKYRRTGLMSRLICAAEEYAKTHGASIMEAYPHDAQQEAKPLSIYTGVASVFFAAGYVEVARRKPNRPVMRKNL